MLVCFAYIHICQRYKAIKVVMHACTHGNARTQFGIFHLVYPEQVSDGVDTKDTGRMDTRLEVRCTHHCPYHRRLLRHHGIAVRPRRTAPGWRSGPSPVTHLRHPPNQMWQNVLYSVKAGGAAQHVQAWMHIYPQEYVVLACSRGVRGTDRSEPHDVPRKYT